MIAIEFNGERMWVNSLDGHGGCTVIATDVPGPSDEPCELCPETGVALVDDAQAEERRLNDMTHAELLAEIMSRIG